MTEDKKHDRKVLLDTCVLLEYFLNSKRAEEVEKILDKITGGDFHP